MYRFILDNVPAGIWESDFSGQKEYYDSLIEKGVKDFKSYFIQHPDEFIKILGLFHLYWVNKYVLDMYKISEPNTDNNDLWMKRVYGDINNPNNLKKMIDFQLMYIYGTDLEWKFIDSKGETRYALYRRCIPQSYEKTWKRVISISVDITEIKKTELQLRKYKKHLEKLVRDRTKDLISSNLNLEKSYESEKNLRKLLEHQIEQRINYNRILIHELKTPLIPILGTGNMLLNRLADETSQKMMQNIMAGANSLSNRINDLVDIERINSGVFRLTKNLVDCRTLLIASYNYVQQQAKDNGQEFILDIPDELPYIYGDFDRLQQILLNLLDNAFKYTQYGGRVILRCKFDKSNVLIEIEDNGPGISPEANVLLFEPYCNISNDNDRHHGLGLGLFLCKKLLELHNGRISLLTELGKGSKFTISMPISST